ncbi:MAG: DUF4331 domain-containing protein [Planctomycetes bacterium]|nr:DUF4331 domain-containing protein [Planctomycetota bacterium]
MKTRSLLLLSASAALVATLPALASSHREAPNITKNPKVDATDFYLFRSYEAGREDYVTVVANYIPLQAPYGGPNYFAMDPEALYEIHFDNDGDAVEDVTFQFRFQNDLQDIALDIGPVGNTKRVSVPLLNVGPISEGSLGNLNVRESYSVRCVFGDRRTGAPVTITNAVSGAARFDKPVDNIGNKSIADYAAYAAAHRYEIALPDGSTGRMFVGQRKDPFQVNLGEAFDLVNLNPVGDPAAAPNTIDDANVTSIVLELPIQFVTANSPIVGGWTTASLRQARVLNPAPRSAVENKVTVEGGAWVQVSRLSMPLVNELVIGIKDKDRFNASEPVDDAQFADYVTNPTLPALLQALFGVTAPTQFPRSDLVSIFLTGVDGVNQPVNVRGAEMLRLNTSTAAVPAGQQNRLGVVGGDVAGYPNGRRPGDDVVDISLRAVMGVLLDAGVAPSGQLPYTDGTMMDASFVDAMFPYLRTPIPGSPNASVALAGGVR